MWTPQKRDLTEKSDKLKVTTLNSTRTTKIDTSRKKSIVQITYGLDLCNDISPDITIFSQTYISEFT